MTIVFIICVEVVPILGFRHRLADINYIDKEAASILNIVFFIAAHFVVNRTVYNNTVYMSYKKNSLLLSRVIFENI